MTTTVEHCVATQLEVAARALGLSALEVDSDHYVGGAFTLGRSVRADLLEAVDAVNPAIELPSDDTWELVVTCLGRDRVRG